MRRAIIALVLGVVGLVALPTAAHADEDDWSIPRYDVVATAAKDGTIDVRLDFDFDFSDTEGHGPYVTLPLRQAIADDPDHYRSFAITNIRPPVPAVRRPAWTPRPTAERWPSRSATRTSRSRASRATSCRTRSRAS